MAIIKIQNQNLVLDTPYTILTTDLASGVSSLTVKNISGFAINQVLIIGEIGEQGSEVVKTHSATAPTGTTVTLAAATSYPHSSSTPVRLIQYDQVEFSTATTTGGSKSVLSTQNLSADALTSNYIDNAGSTGYYFGRFYNSILTTFSGYSDPIPVAGFGLTSARTIIDKALSEINKTTSETLTDAFAFQQIDNCQTEVIRELKRWSFLQKFDSNIGQLPVGGWRLAVPTDQDDQNTFKSVYNLRVGTKERLTKVDKEKFDEMLYGVGYSTLSVALIAGATSITLTDSSDFGTSGTVTINGNSYTYTANSKSTNILTISTTVTASNVASSGDYCFEGAPTGLPEYVTTYGGYFYFLPVVASDYDKLNVYEDYYVAQTQIVTDSNTLVVPDPLLVIYYLCEKFLKRLNSGDDSEGSKSYYEKWVKRLVLLKNKETLGKTFKMRPRVQNFSTQTATGGSDSKRIRTGGFSNTGL